VNYIVGDDTKLVTNQKEKMALWGNHNDLFRTFFLSVLFKSHPSFSIGLSRSYTTYLVEYSPPFSATAQGDFPYIDS